MIGALNRYYNYFVFFNSNSAILRHESSGMPAKVNRPHYLFTAKGLKSDLILHCEEKPTNFCKPRSLVYKETGKVSLVID